MRSCKKRMGAGTAPRRGRPRRFDVDIALDQATRLFWARGFAATSVADLGTVLGVHPPSLYAAWQSKADLFCHCLSHYALTTGVQPVTALREATSLDAGLTAFFKGLLDGVTSRTQPRGCFMVASMAEVATLPTEAQKLIAGLRESYERALKAAATSAQGRGELDAHIDPQVFGWLIAAFGLALSLEARGCKSRRALEQESKVLQAILRSVARGQVALD